MCKKEIGPFPKHRDGILFWVLNSVLAAAFPARHGYRIFKRVVLLVVYAILIKITFWIILHYYYDLKESLFFPLFFFFLFRFFFLFLMKKRAHRIHFGSMKYHIWSYIYIPFPIDCCVYLFTNEEKNKKSTKNAEPVNDNGPRPGAAARVWFYPQVHKLQFVRGF